MTPKGQLLPSEHGGKDGKLWDRSRELGTKRDSILALRVEASDLALAVSRVAAAASPLSLKPWRATPLGKIIALAGAPIRIA
jgi:hypothetical protein